MEKLSILTMYYLNTIRCLMNESLILQASSAERFICQSGFTEVTRTPNHEVYSHSTGYEALMQNHAHVWEAGGHKVLISTTSLMDHTSVSIRQNNSILFEPKNAR